jgi:tRNA-Thr(GGU) m(6)t(6)A37 methyltransferase TsaA
MKIIARIRNDYDGKFGVPRQSGLVEEVVSTIVFEPEYRVPEALRGIEAFSHLWLIWAFDRTERENWSPTVRPPRLGGNTRLGVFATRSSFRPNPLAMSCVKIEEIRNDKENGPVIVVSGADLMDGTPIVDIKPYLPYADSIPDAVGGFAATAPESRLQVEIPEVELEKIAPEKRHALIELLRQDPRPHYQDDPSRIYGLKFAGHEIKFRVQGESLTVIDII